jgi:hypothetical protein
LNGIYEVPRHCAAILIRQCDKEIKSDGMNIRGKTEAAVDILVDL